jgi:hypothetical protein
VDESQQARASTVEPIAANPSLVQRVAPSRRQLIVSALAAAPTMAVMANRPAWAMTGCVAPSAWLSVQIAQTKGIALSHQPSTSSFNQGRSPSYWAQFYLGILPYPLFLTIFNGLGAGNSFPNWLSSFAAIFGTGSTQTFGAILCTMSGTSYYHWVAAYLNALNNNNGSGAAISKYPLTVSQVIAMYNGTFSTNGTTWTSAEGLNYIQTLEG